jgi:hypothetical protein
MPSASLRLLLSVLLTLLAAAALPSQKHVFSTHDWSGSGNSDVWADTKVVGDGRVYSVGTTLLTSSGTPPGIFSGVSAAIQALPFNFMGQKQVIIVQCADPSLPNGIAWQSYFYGSGGNGGRAEPPELCSRHSRVARQFGC